MRQLLAGMGDRLHVDHRHRRILGEALQHAILAIHRPVHELREGAHTDQVNIAAQHLRHFRDVLLRLAVHHGAVVEFDRPGILAGLQHDGMPTQVEGTQLEAAACAQ